MTKIYLFFSALLFIVATAQAQVTKTIHNTFEVGDAQNITLKFDGVTEVTNWSGNTILIESAIKLEPAPQNTLNYFIKDGRYEIILDTITDGYTIRHKLLPRSKLKTKVEDINETVEMHIFVPEEFLIVSKQQLTRK